LATADLPFDPASVCQGNWQPLSGYDATHDSMPLSSPSTEIFWANDLMAVGCYEALHELGIRIPDDTAVMGYDVERSLHLHRPLTAFTAAFRKGEALTLKSSSMQRLDLIKRPQHFIVEYPIAMRGSV
jgi:LacI family transcriptional regulator